MSWLLVASLLASQEAPPAEPVTPPQLVGEIPTVDPGPPRRGINGVVVLAIVIDAEGLVSEVKVERGLTPAVDQQVVAAVQDLTFIPARRGEEPIAVRIRWSVQVGAPPRWLGRGRRLAEPHRLRRRWWHGRRRNRRSRRSLHLRRLRRRLQRMRLRHRRPHRRTVRPGQPPGP